MFPQFRYSPNRLRRNPATWCWWLLMVSPPAPAQTVSVTITEFSVPGANVSDLRGIAPGPDKALWFTLFNEKQIGRITIDGDVMTKPCVGGAGPVVCQPSGIAVGPGGLLWFASVGAFPGFGRIQAETGQVDRLLPFGLGQQQLTGGPDGNLWLADGRGGLFTATLVGSGSVLNGFSATSIATGVDGNIWFTSVNAIGRDLLNPPGGTILIKAPGVGSAVEFGAIAPGPDGAMWFLTANAVGRVTTAGEVTEFSTGSVQPGGGITAGPDGAMWFTTMGSLIGRITMSGEITTYSTPSRSLGPITMGPDGNLWIAEYTGTNIARVQISSGSSVGQSVDLFAYCNTQGYSSVTNIDGTGYGWRCMPGNISIDVTLACQQQYGQNWSATLISPAPGGPNDWRCVRTPTVHALSTTGNSAH